MDLEELQELIRIFEASSISEMEIEEEGRRLLLKKAASPAGMTEMAPAATLVPLASAQAVPKPAPGPTSKAASARTEPVPEAVEAEEEELSTINAPMVGVFYVAPAPGEPPFVEPGDQVEADQTVCIVEAMKLMNEVTAKFPCIIEKVLVENAEPVEYGQPLFAVRPLAEG